MGIMMNTKSNLIGSINLSHRAIATIAYQAALESYGVVGLADENIVRGISRLLSKDPTAGVSVHFENGMVDIDMYLVIEYGTRISSVSQSAADNIKFKIESMTGLQVNSVNIHVRGLRVSTTD